jgi:hypothetical protein
VTLAAHLATEGSIWVGWRVLLVLVGVALLLANTISVTKTVVIPRALASRLVFGMHKLVSETFGFLGRLSDDFEMRDRLLTFEAGVMLLAQLLVWLAVYVLGFGLILWALENRGLGYGLTEAGSSLFTLGFAVPARPGSTVVDFFAAATGMVLIAVQIGYLPALYSSFQRREASITLLLARAGTPAFGPELLARTRYGLSWGYRIDVVLADLFRSWELWAADVAESHTSYPVLIFVRSPTPMANWLTSLLAVLDAAAMMLAVAPSLAPELEARMCLRMGAVCLRQVAGAAGLEVPGDQDEPPALSLTYSEFEQSVRSLEEVGFPVERGAQEAWGDFAGWRVNYELPAHLLATLIDAPPALWSGPRRRPYVPVAPERPADRRFRAK